uniref:Uncharacterized protein n=1 Tax=Triticum urartu TaxID=4572 RepID=A0A8R7UDZ8_TRIUA
MHGWISLAVAIAILANPLFSLSSLSLSLRSKVMEVRGGNPSRRICFGV